MPLLTPGLRRRVLVTTAAVTAAVCAATGSTLADASPAAPETAIQVGPKVVHTGVAPTGYSVTFRVYAPTATSMAVKGTWSFASDTSVSTDPTNASPISAADWQPGDFPLQSPNTPGEGWPVALMKKQANGVWTYTVPLPSGVFDYQFYANCPTAPTSTTGCTAMLDPANPPPVSGGNAAAFSQVYVASDPAFGTPDLSWQAPAAVGHRGTLTDIAYPTANATNGSGTNRVAVYLPPGYNANRATPYPVFVLSHGGGENEMAWPTRGDVAPIVDNLIAAGKMQPAVIVMPNGSGISNYTSEIADTLLPWVEQHYDVGTTAAYRAYAGTSAYGGQANKFIFDPTRVGTFGYYGAWSPANSAPPLVGVGAGYPAGPPTAPAYQDPTLKQLLGLHVAIGEYDLGGNAPMATAQTERIGLINAGVPFTWYSVGGGHTFTFWRLALYDFLTRVGFRATTTTVTAATSTKILSAIVTAATPGAGVPTGTVQFKADGVNVGSPVTLVRGRAALAGYGPVWKGKTVTAMYSGSGVYNASTGTTS